MIRFHFGIKQKWSDSISEYIEIVRFRLKLNRQGQLPFKIEMKWSDSLFKIEFKLVRFLLKLNRR